jgi:hypothetical protein
MLQLLSAPGMSLRAGSITGTEARLSGCSAGKAKRGILVETDEGRSSQAPRDRRIHADSFNGQRVRRDRLSGPQLLAARDAYDYPHGAGITVHEDNWRLDPRERFTFREHEGRGYRHGGHWVTVIIVDIADPTAVRPPARRPHLFHIRGYTSGTP